MLSVSQAESIILDLVTPLSKVETINLENALTRILATPVYSRIDFPYWDNSAMDGYGVKYADVVNSSPTQPTKLSIIEEIPAGYQPVKSLQAKEAVRIFTGAMIPEGVDTIVIQENTHREGNEVIILSPPQNQGAYIRKRGAFALAGDCLLSQGIEITPAELAVLATAQSTEVTVYQRPKVAIFSTGDELITPSETLTPGKIIDSNQYALAGFVSKMGAIPLSLGIVRDQPDLLRKTIREAITQADVVLSTGGVSVGDYDYIESILRELGATIHISSVAIKPGKPLTVAKFPTGCLYFGIPGNPVSALVTCWRFVQPALKKLSGLKDNYGPVLVKGRSLSPLHSDGKRETYLWGKLSLDEGDYQFELASGSHNSANLINLAQTNALAIVPVGISLISPGEPVLSLVVAN